MNTLFADMDLLMVLILFAAYVLVVLAPLCAFLMLVYYLLTLPLRRKERARVVLDFLELGAKEGPGQAFAVPQGSRLKPLGKSFNRFVLALASGATLSEALDREPTLLPRPVREMLKVGERIGDIRKVLPACRRHLTGAVSQVRASLNYLILLTFLVTPAAIIVPLVIAQRVLPKLQEIVSEMLLGQPLPALTRVVFNQSHLFAWAQVLFLVIMLAATLAYVFGPRLHRIAPNLADWIAFQLPWKRKRILRDFSSMLAILLDSSVPEPEALLLAGSSVANSTVARRVRSAHAQLAFGLKLTEAVALVDGSGEFIWRFRNAAHRRGGFLKSLAGWHEALDAKAFQLEQTAAQLMTTTLLLVNGAFVAAVVISVFMVLIQIIQGGTLW